MAPPVQLPLTFRAWGGTRRGAGRPPTLGRRRVPHRGRPPHDRHCPVHVTLRAAAGVPSLRGARVFGALRVALGASSAAGFRILQFSAQRTHVHLLVEADAPARRPRRAGPHDSRRQGGEPDVRAPRPRVGGSLPRAVARVTARDPGRARVRASQRQEAHPRRPRDGSVLVRGVVPRLADARATATPPLAGPGPPHLVGAGGLAPARPAPGRRGPPRPVTDARAAAGRSDGPTRNPKEPR